VLLDQAFTPAEQKTKMVTICDSLASSSTIRLKGVMPLWSYSRIPGGVHCPLPRPKRGFRSMPAEQPFTRQLSATALSTNLVGSGSTFSLSWESITGCRRYAT
jgi:hypothetical protein